jgi:hypothetical protein
VSVVEEEAPTGSVPAVEELDVPRPQPASESTASSAAGATSRARTARSVVRRGWSD